MGSEMCIRDRLYYPLTEEARPEYERWRATQAAVAPTGALDGALDDAASGGAR